MLSTTIEWFSKDLNDPVRPSFTEKDLVFYYNKYFKKNFSVKNFGTDKFDNFVRLVKDTVGGLAQEWKDPAKKKALIAKKKEAKKKEAEEKGDQAPVRYGTTFEWFMKPFWLIVADSLDCGVFTVDKVPAVSGFSIPYTGGGFSMLCLDSGVFTVDAVPALAGFSIS